MKAKFTHSYIVKSRSEGRPDRLAIAYTVSGTKEELQDFKKAQGPFYRETESGKPVFIKGFDMNRCIGYLPDLKKLTLMKNVNTGQYVSTEA